MSSDRLIRIAYVRKITRKEDMQITGEAIEYLSIHLEELLQQAMIRAKNLGKKRITGFHLHYKFTPEDMERVRNSR